MKQFSQFLLGTLILVLMMSCQSPKKDRSKDSMVEKVTEEASPTIVTEDNFPHAYTNMRLGAILQKTGGVNKFFTMPVPSSVPAEQFVVRMNRDTPYSSSVIDMSSDSVFVTVPLTDKYVTIQIVDENHETQPMIYGPGRHKITAKTDYAFVIVRAGFRIRGAKQYVGVRQVFGIQANDVQV